MNKTETITAEQYREMTKKGKATGLSKARKASSSGANFLANIKLAFMQKGYLAISEHAFHPTRRWRFDLAFPEYKIAVEYEGLFSEKSRHTTANGYTGDIEKYEAAQELGWFVFRVTALNKTGLVAKIEKKLKESQKK